jgi:hypothetical protein
LSDSTRVIVLFQKDKVGALIYLALTPVLRGLGLTGLRGLLYDKTRKFAASKRAVQK